MTDLSHFKKILIVIFWFWRGPNRDTPSKIGQKQIRKPRLPRIQLSSNFDFLGSCFPMAWGTYWPCGDFDFLNKKNRLPLFVGFFFEPSFVVPNFDWLSSISVLIGPFPGGRRPRQFAERREGEAEPPPGTVEGGAEESARREPHARWVQNLKKKQVPKFLKSKFFFWKSYSWNLTDSFLSVSEVDFSNWSTFLD